MLILRQPYENLPTKEYLNRDILITISYPLASFLVRKISLIFLARLNVISRFYLMVQGKNYFLQVIEYLSNLAAHFQHHEVMSHKLKTKKRLHEIRFSLLFFRWNCLPTHLLFSLFLVCRLLVTQEGFQIYYQYLLRGIYIVHF